MANAKILYVIPARGGSKGIPGKNIKPLAGKPLIQYSIDVARELADDADICVSTDAENIRSVAENVCGLKVPFMRPDYLATDGAGTYEVLLHALDYYHAQGIDYDILVLLQPTSPLRTATHVREALALYTPEMDMVVSVKVADANPYYNLFEADANGYLHVSKGEGNITRRQNAPKVYEYNGAVYVINVKSLRKQTLGEFRHRIPYIMDSESSVDMDTTFDWLMAETILKSR